MLNITDFIEKIQSEQIISKESLDHFVSNTFEKDERYKIEYRGYDIRNSIQTFLGYILNIIDDEKKFRLHFSKGEIYTIFHELGFHTNELMSGSYKNELFFIENINYQKTNQNLLRYICDITSQLNKKNYTISGEFSTAYELYQKISKQHKLNRNDSIIVMFNYINQHNLIEMTDFPDKKLLFSHYNPLELYESWYISDIHFTSE